MRERQKLYTNLSRLSFHSYVNGFMKNRPISQWDLEPTPIRRRLININMIVGWSSKERHPYTLHTWKNYMQPSYGLRSVFSAITNLPYLAKEISRKFFLETHLIHLEVRREPDCENKTGHCSWRLGAAGPLIHSRLKNCQIAVRRQSLPADDGLPFRR